MNVLQSTYDELKAERDALAIKAARYDWLRISADISWNGWVTHSMLTATDAERAELDSEIDSAMASSGYEVNTRHGAGDAEAWRPVSEAEEDGEYVQLYVVSSHGSHQTIGYLRNGVWYDQEERIVEVFNSYIATHWRHLPAPPTDDAARAGERG